MAKGRGNITANSEDTAPPQPRSLRSRKRECPENDQTAPSDNIQPALPQQDLEGNVTTMDGTPPQSPQKSTMSSAPQEQAAEQSFPAIENGTTEETYLLATVLGEEAEKSITDEGTGQCETTLTNPNNDSQLKDFRAESASDYSPGGEKEEKMDPNRSPSHTSSDQPQPLLPASKEGLIEEGFCVTVCEEQQCEGASWEHKMEGNQDIQQETNSVCMGHDNGKVMAKEAVAGLPAKKKRRMGMCGLTEKERSHFLQTQKREHVQNGSAGEDRQNCSNTSDIVVEEEIIHSASLSSSPRPIAVVSVTEESEADVKLQSIHCEGEDRAETDVAMTTSDGASNGGDPAGSSEGDTCQADPSTVPHPGQIRDSEMDPPAERGERSGSRSLVGDERQQQEGSAEKYERQMEVGEGGSGELDHDLATTFATQNEETEREHQDSVAKIRDVKVEGTRGDGAEVLTSSVDTRPGVLSAGPADLCDVTATPSGSEGKGNFGPKDDCGTGPTPVNTEHPQTRPTPDPFGPGSLDYVSDSQLNNIVLIEEVMEEDWGLSSSDCHEDATDLVCGLIRELSSLNRTVMATHRELENLRRGNKSSRASTH